MLVALTWGPQACESRESGTEMSATLDSTKLREAQGRCDD